MAFRINDVKNWDVIIVGGGVIGLMLALELRRSGATVLVLDRGEPGREASYASAGMIAWCDPHLDSRLVEIAKASAKLYPPLAKELEDETGDRVDFREHGAILFLRANERPRAGRELSEEALQELEPKLVATGHHAFYVPEACVDPRTLVAAVLQAVKNRGVDVAAGAEVTEIIVEAHKARGVRTARTEYRGNAVVNCAGAWAAHIKAPQAAPTRPAKGHMLAVVGQDALTHTGEKMLLTHVVRDPATVYLVPRSDGRIVIGSTLEPAGFDKRVLPHTIQRLHQQAANLVPEIGQARMLEGWTGLRPATPDNLPIIGTTATPGYFVCTGHYRDGILLAPITAQVMAQVVRGKKPEFDISAFTPARF
jgi:glycine oxidase